MSYPNEAIFSLPEFNLLIDDLHRLSVHSNEQDYGSFTFEVNVAQLLAAYGLNVHMLCFYPWMKVREWDTNRGVYRSWSDYRLDMIGTVLRMETSYIVSCTIRDWMRACYDSSYDYVEDVKKYTITQGPK